MSAVINCLILDDEPLAVKLIGEYARQLPELDVIHAGTRVSDAIDILRSQPVELVLLDIQMPELSGIELMRHFSQRHHFIITSAYQEYALEAFEFQVVDFLLKPVAFDRFRQAINKFIKWREPFNRNSDNGHLMIRADRQYQSIRLDDIIYIEALKDYIRIHTGSGQVLVWENMKDIMGKLPAGRFLRIHRSYIIPVEQLKLATYNRVQLQNTDWLPIGETYRKAIAEWLARFS